MAPKAKPIKVVRKPVEEEEDIPEVSAASVEEVEETVEEASIPVVAVSPKVVQPNMVRINVFVTLEPAPVIGHYSFVREHGISKLVPGSYTVPWYVAEHLIDKKMAQLI
jgi:hypothetical protein